MLRPGGSKAQYVSARSLTTDVSTFSLAHRILMSTHISHVRATLSATALAELNEAPLLGSTSESASLRGTAQCHH